jgi:ADP-ribose pyrophosphatase YjhB (NUDIX family)
VTGAPQLGVGGVLLRDRRVLLVRRAHPPLEGSFSLPGGKVRPHERLRAALAREMLEETGLRVRAGPLLEVVEILREGFHYVVTDYLCEPLDAGAEPVAGSDAAAVRWAEADELEALGASAELRRVVAIAIAMRHAATAESG